MENIKCEWDLSIIYKDEKDFLADFEKASKLIKSFAKHEKTMTRGAGELYATLSDYTAIDGIIERLWQYAFLNFSLDTSNNSYQAMTGKMQTLATKAGEASWFVEPYLLKLERSVIDGWFSELPELERFRRMIEKILRKKPYILSDDGEKIMSKIQDALGTHDDIRSIFSNSDLRFGKIRNEEGKLVELTDTNYVTWLMSKSRKVRQSAFKTIYKTYAQFANTYATMYNGRVRESVTLAKVRGYKDSLTASTFHDEVTPDIYNNLISTVRTGLPSLYEYYELKRRILGVERLHLYDIYTPLVESFEKKYTYEESVDEVLKTVSAYGSEYYEALRSGLCEKGWVDVYPKKGKRSGAFSSGCPGTEPYILMNFNGEYDDVATLAHEAGHSMHTYYSTKANEPHNSGYTLFVAEVASTVNELLLAHRKLAECKSDDEKLYILNNLIETYKGTLFRQTMFAEFEKEMHAISASGETLTAEVIKKRYYKLVKKYFGSGVVCDKEIALEWARVPHFYRCFYVYKYATCISAASAIVKRIETEGEAYVNKYIDFLRCGDSRSPLESLLVAGIDMTDPSVIKCALDDFDQSLKQFKEIYENKIK